MTLREDANYIIANAIKRVLPDEAVTRAIKEKLDNGGFSQGKIYVVAAGKAGWQMAKAASDILKDSIAEGICITKYNHVCGDIPGFICIEAGHPVPDENSFKGTEQVLKLAEKLTAQDTVIFLLSGGGSALFEKPLVSGEELADITSQLLACGADITEINTIRKRLSAVKGGKFAKLCEPAKIFSIVLSDIVGDPLDMIASGPAYPDSSSSADALAVIEKYNIRLSDTAMEYMNIETPKEITNVETVITGSVKNLCIAAAEACKDLGYAPIVLTDQLTCEAREAGAFLSAIAKSNSGLSECSFAYGGLAETEGISKAFIVGGETVVYLTGNGKGGRNQELALSAAEGISGLDNVCVFSVGSDGTDGPTDAAGGYVDGSTLVNLEKQGFRIYNVLKENDAYNALSKVGGLIITGATGTNVNDFAVLLIK